MDEKRKKIRIQIMKLPICDITKWGYYKISNLKLQCQNFVHNQILFKYIIVKSQNSDSDYENNNNSENTYLLKKNISEKNNSST